MFWFMFKLAKLNKILTYDYQDNVSQFVNDSYTNNTLFMIDST